MLFFVIHKSIINYKCMNCNSKNRVPNEAPGCGRRTVRRQGPGNVQLLIGNAPAARRRVGVAGPVGAQGTAPAAGWGCRVARKFCGARWLVGVAGTIRKVPALPFSALSPAALKKMVFVQAAPKLRPQHSGHGLPRVCRHSRARANVRGILFASRAGRAPLRHSFGERNCAAPGHPRQSTTCPS